MSAMSWSISLKKAFDR